ncbi:MAG: galactofuranose transport system permease protein [Frankiales bacterium]|jgi:ribose transport system permease protein|nr:galactofuranose transport system permease protein [Frankiales bacterium]
MTAVTPDDFTSRLRVPRIDLEWVRDKGVYLALLALGLYNVLFTPHFNEFSNMQLIMKQVSAVLIVSLGMLLVIGTGGIDLSVGATMAIAGSVLGLAVSPGSSVSGGMGLSLSIAVVLAILSGLVVGLFNGFVVGVLGVQPIVATLSLLVGGRGLALVLTSGGLVQLFTPGLTKLSAGNVHGWPYVILIALALVVVVAVLVRRTTFGYRLVAIGGNRRASVLAGLPVRRTIITVYALSGVLAAIAGIIATARLHSADPSYLGIGFELNAITAVVVGGSALSGGRVKILGTLAGAVLMQLLTSTLASHDVPASATQVIQAGIIVAAVYIQRTSRSSE